MSHIIVPPWPLMIYASGRVLCISVQRASAFFFFIFFKLLTPVSLDRPTMREKEKLSRDREGRKRGWEKNHKASQGPGAAFRCYG